MDNSQYLPDRHGDELTDNMDLNEELRRQGKQITRYAIKQQEQR